MINVYPQKVISQGALNDINLNFDSHEHKLQAQVSPDFSYLMTYVSHNLPVIIYQIDLVVPKLDWVTPQVFEQLGFSAEDLQQPDDLFLKCIHPKDYPVLLSGMEFFVTNPELPNKGIFRICDQDQNWRRFDYIMKLTDISEDGLPLKALGMAMDTTGYLGANADRTVEREKLSPREKEVLNLIVDGLNDKEIAERLFISTFTAESHRKNILKKLHAKNTASLVRIALTEGLTN